MDDAVRVVAEMNLRFLDVLRTATLPGLQQRTTAAYGAAVGTSGKAHFLGYHQAIHVAMHCGQIRTIRNLYRKTRGQPARFFPRTPRSQDNHARFVREAFSRASWLA